MLSSLFILIFFIFSRILLNSLWLEISVYYSYVYELCFVGIVYFLKRESVKSLFNFKLEKSILFRLVPWPILGFAFHYLANFSGITIPFEFKSLEMILMLLMIAPILEELIFRFAMWELFSDLVKNKEIQIWFTAIMFSLGHFMAIFMISPDLRPFVLYQSLYVVILAIGAGRIRQESNNVFASILVHFLFNLGFYLSYLIVR